MRIMHSIRHLIMKKFNLDKIGSTVAGLCFIHCLIFPLLITLLPFASFYFVPLDVFETILFSLALLFGVISICAGFKKHKQYSGPFMISVGLFLLMLGRLSHNSNLSSVHLPIMILASLVLITGHFINNRLCNIHCPKCKHVADV